MNRRNSVWETTRSNAGVTAVYLVFWGLILPQTSLLLQGVLQRVLTRSCSLCLHPCSSARSWPGANFLSSYASSSGLVDKLCESQPSYLSTLTFTHISPLPEIWVLRRQLSKLGSPRAWKPGPIVSTPPCTTSWSLFASSSRSNFMVSGIPELPQRIQIFVSCRLWLKRVLFCSKVDLQHPFQHCFPSSHSSVRHGLQHPFPPVFRHGITLPSLSAIRRRLHLQLARLHRSL